jgi:hypothetical protein
MHSTTRTSRRSPRAFAALAGVAVAAMLVGPSVGVADAAKAKAKPKPVVIKTKSLVVKVDPALAAAVAAQQIVFGPLAPATGDGASGIKMKTKGSITVKNGKAGKTTIAATGGINLDASALLGQVIEISNLSLNLNGATGAVKADVTLLGADKTVLDATGVKVTGKKVTGNLVFNAEVGGVLGALIPEAATGKSFGTFTVS